MTTPQLDAARDLFDQLDTAAATTPAGEPLPLSSLEALDDAGLAGLLVPREVGGKELDLADIIDVYEEVSRADGSLGWCFFASDLIAAYFGADFLFLRRARGLILDAGAFLRHAHFDVAAELDVGAAARHVGGDGDRTGHARFGDDIGFLFVEARVQDGKQF